MVTQQPPELRSLADDWDNRMDYPSAVFAGIVGDANHPNGYHISYDNNSKTNYSVVLPQDRPPNINTRDAAAIDMSMNKADMAKCHTRLKAIWANSNDPRRRFIRAFNGWDGYNGAGRYDNAKNTSGSATPDHKTHTHLEVYRMFVRNVVALDGIRSALRGESPEAYAARISGGTATMADVDTIYAMLFTGGTDMGPALDPKDRSTTNNPSNVGNGLTDLLQYIRKQIDKLSEGQGVVVLTDDQLDKLSVKVAQMLADKTKEMVKEALREGTDS